MASANPQQSCNFSRGRPLRVPTWPRSGGRLSGFVVERPAAASSDDAPLLLAIERMGSDSSEPAASALDRELAGLGKAVEMLANVEGKKVLVYFGRPMKQEADAVKLKAVIDSAVQAKVAFYMIDSRGLAGAAGKEIPRQ